MIEIYVDGSYIDGKIGYGAVILKDDKIIEELSGQVVDSEALSSRQVGGELKAVVESLKYCMKENITTVGIYYDYKGIECWACGKWKTNKELTKNYAKFVKSLDIKIKWNKVDAHTGVKWNDHADMLAKKGASGGVQGNHKKTVTKSSKDKNRGQSPDLIEELTEVADKYIDYLGHQDIDGMFSGIKNNMFARIEIIECGKRVGIFDLYNTAKKRLSPDLRGFKDNMLQNMVKDHWRDFISASKKN